MKKSKRLKQIAKDIKAIKALTEQGSYSNYSYNQLLKKKKDIIEDLKSIDKILKKRDITVGRSTKGQYTAFSEVEKIFKGMKHVKKGTIIEFNSGIQFEIIDIQSDESVDLKAMKAPLEWMLFYHNIVLKDFKIIK